MCMEHETRFELAVRVACGSYRTVRSSLTVLPSRWQIVPGIVQTPAVAHLLLILAPALLGTDAR